MDVKAWEIYRIDEVGPARCTQHVHAVPAFYTIEEGKQLVYDSIGDLVK